MTPKEYKEATGKSVETLAEEWGCAVATAYKYIDGTRKPTDPEQIRRIYDATGGLLTANSFYLPNVANHSESRVPRASSS